MVVFLAFLEQVVRALGELVEEEIWEQPGTRRRCPNICGDVLYIVAGSSGFAASSEFVAGSSGFVATTAAAAASPEFVASAAADSEATVATADFVL